MGINTIQSASHCKIFYQRNLSNSVAQKPKRFLCLDKRLYIEEELSSDSENALNESTESWWREWDGSIEPGDATDQAFESLDISKLMPHPEYRNVAAGQVYFINKNTYDLLWNDDNGLNKSEEDKKLHDQQWEEYLKENGFTPTEYFSSHC